MSLKEILNLVVMAAGVGGLLYLFNLLPIEATIKRITTALVIILAALWALRWFVWKLTS